MSTSIQNGCVKATSTSGNIVSICNGIITAAEPGESSSINTNGKQPVTTLSGPKGTMEVVGNKETTASKTLNSNSTQAIQIKKSTLYSPPAAVFSPTIKSNTLNNTNPTTANNIGIINWLEKYWYIIVGAAISIILIAYIMR